MDLQQLQYHSEKAMKGDEGSSESSSLHASSNSKCCGYEVMMTSNEVIYEVIMMKFTIERKFSLERSGAQNLAHS